MCDRSEAQSQTFMERKTNFRTKYEVKLSLYLTNGIPRREDVCGNGTTVLLFLISVLD
jgi:hypothetical protein